MVGAKRDDKFRLLLHILSSVFFILIDRKLFKLRGGSKRTLTTNFLLRYRLLPHKEDPNNEVAKEANSQNKKSIYCCTFNLSAENQFLSILCLSHCFCQFHRPQGGGWAGIYCNRPWSLALLLLSYCWSASSENKPWSVTPISTRMLDLCAMTLLPGSDADICQLACSNKDLPFFEGGEKFPPTTAYCYFSKQRLRGVTWLQT